MRLPALLFISTLAINGLHAESLTDADRETLLENLEKLREAADSRVDARFRVAIAAFRNAIGSDDAAIDLYLNCMEKVNFQEEQRKAADFREWKRQEAEKLSDPGLRLALRHQLRWLMLTLQAASEKADRAKLAADAQDIVESIFREPEKLKGQERILNQGVTSSVFAQAYDINEVKVEKWPLSPVELESIYDNILLPPYRNPSQLAGLRAGWIRRIQQETLKREHWVEGKRGNRENREEREDKEDRRIGTLESMQSPEYLKFVQEEVPELMWQMEVDLFLYGDESGASVRMLAHLEKYLNHPSNRKWGTEFEKLLKPAAPAATPAAETAEAPAGPAGNVP